MYTDMNVHIFFHLSLKMYFWTYGTIFRITILISIDAINANDFK